VRDRAPFRFPGPQAILPAMTNTIAIGLAVVLAAAIAADQFAFGGVGTVWVGRAFVGLVDWIAFWH